MRAALGPILQFLIGTTMIYVGFTFFGTIMYGYPGGMFESFGDSFVTLFSVMGGDSVLMAFQNTGMTLSGLIYLFFFGITFICAIANVILVQMEAIYFQCVPALVPEVS